MADTPRDAVYLTDHAPGKGPYVCLWSDDHALVERFRIISYLALPLSLGWFHQCSSEHFHMFEFWKPDHDGMVAAAREIAEHLDIEVVINLAQTYAHAA